MRSGTILFGVFYKQVVRQRKGETAAKQGWLGSYRVDLDGVARGVDLAVVRGGLLWMII